MTVFGDSVAASILYVPAAQTYLRRRYDVKLDLAVCRRLVAPSCVYQGHQPSTALQAIRARRGHLGRTVVMDVGYSDDASAFRSDLDRIMSTLRAEGVRTVVWTTFRENGNESYHLMNGVLRNAHRRWRMLKVADWNAWSQGHAWFASDGLHLNAAGAVGLARLIAKTVGTGR